MYDFISIGDTQLDTIMVLDPKEVELLCNINNHEAKICLDFASKIPVSVMETMVAGNAANAAITAARMDGKTGFWTMLGDDEVAEYQIKYLEAENVDTTHARRTPGTKSNRSTVISVSGERTILVYHDPRNYDLPNDLPESKWIYLTSMAQGSEIIFGELADYLQKTKAKLVYQPGTYQLRIGTKPAESILRNMEVVIMNKEEAQLYSDNNTDNIVELLKALKDLGPKIVVVTDGTEGSYAFNGERAWYLGVRPEIPRIEATGAGDAFASAFTVGLMKGQKIPEAMRWGTFNAEGVIQKYGPQAGILTRTQIEHEAANNNDFQAKEISTVT